MSIIGIDEILTIIPHRYPFILVDRIIELDEEEKKIVGIKNVSMNEPFFQGHFPGQPIMPGVLQLEAMAQVGGILLNRVAKREGKIAYFLGINNAKFRQIVRPGDQMRIEVVFKKMRLNVCKVEGRVLVDDKVSAQADLTFGGAEE